MPMNPPDMIYMPWQHVTLVSFGSPISGQEVFQVNDILGLLRKQLDPHNRGFNQVQSGDGRFVVQFRLKTIRAWNMSGYMIALAVDDFVDTVGAKGDRDQMFSGVDTGSSTTIPRIGFQLPASHRSMVLRTDDTTGEEYLFTVQVAARDRAMIYIDIEYRFDGPPKIHSVNSPAIEMVRVATSSRTVLNSIRETTEKIQEHQPDVMDELVDDVKKVASFVVPLAKYETSEVDNLRKRVCELEELMARLGKVDGQSGSCSSYDIMPDALCDIPPIVAQASGLPVGQGKCEPSATDQSPDSVRPTAGVVAKKE